MEGEGGEGEEGQDGWVQDREEKKPREKGKRLEEVEKQRRTQD